MLIIIIFGSLLVIGLILYILDTWIHWWSEIIGILGIVGAILGGVTVFVFGLVMLGQNSQSSAREVQVWYEQEVISLRTTENTIRYIEDDYARSITIFQYNQSVREFKTKILTKQENLKNPWINWLVTYSWSTLDAEVVNYYEA